MINKAMDSYSSQFAKLHELLGDNAPEKSKEKASRFTLSRYLDLKKINYITALNALQSAGVISDNVCELCDDIYPGDQYNAVNWLKSNTYTDDDRKQFIRGYNG